MQILFAVDACAGAPLIHTIETCKHLCTLGNDISLVINAPFEHFKGIDRCKHFLVPDVKIARGSMLKIITQDGLTVLKSLLKRCDLIYTRNVFIAFQLKFLRITKPVVWEVNGLSSVELSIRNANPLKLATAKAFEERFIPMFLDKIIAVTNSIKEIMIKSGVDKNKIDVVLNGVDNIMFNPSIDGSDVRNRFHIKDNEILLIFVGNIYVWHGIEHMFNIFSCIRKKRDDVKLMIVGTDERQLSPDIRELIARLKIKDRLIFTGWVDNKDIPMYIASADAGIHTGVHHYELNPFKVLEYMACAKPVIGTAHGLKELITNSNGGIIIEPLDYEGSAEKILNLIESNERVMELGKNARNYVVEHHDWKKNTEILNQILIEVVHR